MLMLVGRLAPSSMTAPFTPWARRSVNTSSPALQAMKLGTPIPGLDFMKNEDPPVALERSEYPDWVNDLDKPMITLAKLRRMREEDATDKEKMRYLKLTRRIQIKNNNADASS
mmetsp:Transcript_4877/g.8455  ORF Transcript_4877/g.8455 Transcript_4877/m.8455 type:complete len:113 (-) Transcript_4877:207-545(-)